MADITFAQRRVILRKVQGIVNEMIQINEVASRLAATMLTGGVPGDDDKVEPLLSQCGPATAADHDAVGETTLSDVIVAILYGSLTDDDTSTVLGWGWDGT